MWLDGDYEERPENTARNGGPNDSVNKLIHFHTGAPFPPRWFSAQRLVGTGQWMTRMITCRAFAFTGV
jgi:hypothetical protein